MRKFLVAISNPRFLNSDNLSKFRINIKQCIFIHRSVKIRKKITELSLLMSLKHIVLYYTVIVLGNVYYFVHQPFKKLWNLIL